VKIGMTLGYWSRTPPADLQDTLAVVDDLGLDSVWVAESWGNDAFTYAAWVAAHTKRVKIGTGIVQMAARTPTATAMAAVTVDHLSNGRFILGLGASGPQVVEGWYGQPYPKPLARTREYVEVIRQVLERREVDFQGEHYQIPNMGPETMGLGKPIKSITHPRRADLPIFLGAEGPKNVAMAAEIADGWLPIFLSPKLDPHYRECLAEGFARDGARRTADDFEIPNLVSIVIDDDVEAAADFVRMSLGFYIGGMGAREVNFHANVFARMGYGDVVAEIQDLFLAGRKDEAIKKVPLALVEDVALVGPLDKIREELEVWRTTCMTTLLVSGPPPQLRQIKQLVDG
jgi:F420-dependent oxidoreductase-like protein